MAIEKRLISDGKQVTLEELLPGTIFAFGDDCIAVKGEYRCANGLIEAFIIDSGEQFWGGAKSAKEQNKLMVQPLTIVEVDAVEAVTGRWKAHPDEYQICGTEFVCSNCNESFVNSELASDNDFLEMMKFCPNCGADMRERKDNG